MANGDTRSFLIQFMAETGSAVTAMNWLGRSMQKFPSHAVSAAAETEAAMAHVDTAIRKAGASANELVNSFAMMGRDVTDMIRASGVAAKMGLEGAQNLSQFAEVARRFGMVTGKSAEQAGLALSDVGIAMGYKTPEQIEKLASGMTVLSRTTKITTDELVALMGRTGPLSKAIGVSESAVMALGTSFSQQNMKAGQITGTIGNLMNLMQQMQISGTHLGYSLRLSADEMRKFDKATPNEQIEMFMKHLGKMEKFQAEKQLEGMGIASGLAATQMWLAAQQSKNFSSYLKQASDAMKKNTTLTNEANKVERTLTFQLKEVGRQLKGIFVTTGRLLLPVVKLFVMALRGMLFVVMAIPKPILALAAAFAALAAAMLAGAWAAQTKLIVGSIAFVANIYKEIAAVGGLTGAYKLLTSARLADDLMQAAGARRSFVAHLRETKDLAGLAKLKAAGPMGPGVGAMGQPTGAMGGLIGLSAKLGISVAGLVGIALLLVAAFVLIGAAIYKGVRMMESADEKTRTLGAALIFITGPIGLFVLGMKALAAPIQAAGRQIREAIEPLLPTLKRLTPLLYALGAVLAIVFLPVIAPIVAFFGVLYALIPVVVGFVEGFVSALLFGLEPVMPVIDQLGELFGDLASQLGLGTGEASGFWDVMRWIGAAIGSIVGAIVALPVLLIGGLISIFTEFDVIIWGLGEAFSWLGDVAASVGAWVANVWGKFWTKLGNIVAWVKAIWAATFSAIKGGLDVILSPIWAIVSAFEAVIAAVKSVGRALTGSTPWHAKESLEGEVIPALGKTGSEFENVAESAEGVGLQMARPVEEGAVGKRPETIVERMATARYPAPAVPAPAPTAEPPREIKVSIPVVVQLDGLTLGRAVVEQIIELGERNMNPPGFPMRGVEPAFG